MTKEKDSLVDLKQNYRDPKKENIYWHKGVIDRTSREGLNNHKSVLLWFTGLSGSGKSTIAHAVEEKLHELGCRTMVLDGDNIRHGLCGDLSFSKEDRIENIRRIGEVSKLFIDAGIIILTAFISPYRIDRKRVRMLVGDDDFVEIHCDCPLEVCEKRDVKGLYQKAKKGEIKNFTGISAPYQEPLNPALKLKSHQNTLEKCTEQVIHYLFDRKIISKK